MSDTAVVFPRTADGRRSTSATGRAVLADAARAVDPALAARIEGEPDWRRGYLEAVRAVTQVGLGSAERARDVARAGLDSVHRRFRVAGADGAERPLAELLSAPPAAALGTVEVRGEDEPAGGGLAVPYRGALLSGDALRRRLDRWVADGVAEPSFAEALGRVVDHPEWLDLRDLTVVVLGAAAELAPYEPLVRWGAHVVPVDLPGPAWERLLSTARHSAGRVSAPAGPGRPGVDVLTGAPALLAWLRELPGPYALGQYVYADGAAHVRTSVAIDAVAVALLRDRPGTSLSLLATPTDAFLVPPDAVLESRRRSATAPAWTSMLRTASRGRLFRESAPELHPLADGRLAGLNDSLVPLQGPNYALAKRLQRWRADVARADGVRVSMNVAPATRTRSVLRNRVLAAGYAGAHRFGIEVFDPATSRTLMAALLVNDLRDDGALSHPGVALAHPAELLWDGACHSGLWRAPWQARSVLGLAVGAGLPAALRPRR